MTALQLKEKLHHYIDEATERKLKAIYIILEEGIVESEMLSEEKKAVLDDRMSDHKKGIGKTYTWEEAVLHAKKAFAHKHK